MTIFDEYAEAKKKLVDEFKVKFAPFIEALLREHEVPYMDLRGYTPEWCDGEPCEFSMDTHDETETVLEHFSDLDLSNLNKKVPYEKHRAVSRGIRGADDVLEDAFGSKGWQVLAVIDAKDVFHFHFNDKYDCGY